MKIQVFPIHIKVKRWSLLWHAVIAKATWTRHFTAQLCGNLRRWHCIKDV